MSTRFHPFAEIFPLLDGPALQELADDIKQHGLREAIWTFGGLILDGRNRFLACQKANIKPIFRAYVGSEAQALAWVVSANVHRRHLTTEQRAMAAAKVAVLSRGGDTNTARAALTQAQAAEQFSVSPDSIQRAKKVTERGSKPLQKAVERGDIGLKRAAAVVDLPKSEQLAAAEETLREYAPAAEIHFERLAVLPEQIAAWKLPTRPTKQTDSRAKNFKGDSVELDAIHPDRLRKLVKDVIVRHLPAGQLDTLRVAEESEREMLRLFARQTEERRA